jgi:hypothetical protein
MIGVVCVRIVENQLNIFIIRWLRCFTVGKVNTIDIDHYDMEGGSVVYYVDNLV